MKIESLIISVTNEFEPAYKVNHPQVRRWRMSIQQIRRLVDEAAGLGCRLMTFSGGEPFLLGETLHQAIRYAAFRVPTVRVITDCYWADTPNKALEEVARLYQSGLREMDVRFSDWNQEHKYQQWCKWATMAAEQVGITVFADHVMARKEERVSLVHIKEHPASAARSYARALETGAIQDHRQGVSFLPYDPQAKDEPASDELLFIQKVDRSHCPFIFNTVTAHPDGKLTACAGHACRVADDLILGDWFTTPLQDLLERGERDPILQWIRLSGPVALRDYVKKQWPEAEFEDSYANLCHLCGDLLTRYETKRLIHQGAQDAAREVIDANIERLARLRDKLSANGRGAEAGRA